MKKQSKWFIGALVVIAIILLLVWLFEKKQSGIEPKSEPMEITTGNGNVQSPTVVVGDCDTEKTIGVRISGATLVELYTENARLQALLEVCENGGKTTKKAATSTGRSAAKKPAAKTAPKPAPKNTVVAEPEAKDAPKASSSSVTGANLAASEYVGVKYGDICISFDENSMLTYCIKKNIITNIAGLLSPSLNVNNQYRDVYEEDGYYVARSTIKVDINMLLNKARFNFAWHAGTHENGYEIWLPHEAYKEKINPYYPDNWNHPELKEILAPYMVRPNDEKGYEYYGFSINYKPK